jgi:hypothetical protein
MAMGQRSINQLDGCNQSINCNQLQWHWGTGAGATGATGSIVPIAIDRSIVCRVPCGCGGPWGAGVGVFYSMCFIQKSS